MGISVIMPVYNEEDSMVFIFKEIENAENTVNPNTG